VTPKPQKVLTTPSAATMRTARKGCDDHTPDAARQQHNCYAATAWTPKAQGNTRARADTQFHTIPATPHLQTTTPRMHSHTRNATTTYTTAQQTMNSLCNAAWRTREKAHALEHACGMLAHDTAADGPSALAELNRISSVTCNGRRSHRGDHPRKSGAAAGRKTHPCNAVHPPTPRLHILPPLTEVLQDQGRIQGLHLLGRARIGLGLLLLLLRKLLLLLLQIGPALLELPDAVHTPLACSRRSCCWIRRSWRGARADCGGWSGDCAVGCGRGRGPSSGHCECCWGEKECRETVSEVGRGGAGALLAAAGRRKPC
jgi:hypothetical protein